MSVNSTLQSITFVSKIMMTWDSTNVKLVLIMILATGFECCYGYTISECGSDGKVDLDETRPAVLTCTGMITNDTVHWNLDRTGGASGLSIAFCEWPNTTCTTHNMTGTTVNSSWYEVTMTEYNTSTLTVKHNHRESIAGTVTCGTLTSTSAPCRVRVVHNAETVSNCSVSVDKSTNWTVTASCDVDRMYASDRHYSCRWVVPDGHGTNTTEEGTLSTTQFTDNNGEYMRGACSISDLPMPTADGTYKYDVILDPGNARLTGPSLEIKQPRESTLSNCPDFITEGEDVNCTCLAADSSPRAVTTWFVANTDYDPVLQLRNVSASMHGTSYTCTQYWGSVFNNFLKRTGYTVRVIAEGDKPTTAKGDSTGDNNDRNEDTNDEGLPIPVIAGGAGGGIVVIIIIVVVVKKREGSPQLARHTDPTSDNIAIYELPTRRSQVVDTNIYTSL